MILYIASYSLKLNASDLINSLGQKEDYIASCMYIFHLLHFILFHFPSVPGFIKTSQQSKHGSYSN